MSKDLAGVLFIYCGERFDYCYKEAIQCLAAFCDAVYVVAVESEDGTIREVLEMEADNSKIDVFLVPEKEWHEQQGRQKLNYFTNIGIGRAERDGYKYVFNLQADEILSENSYQWVRKAIEGGQEGFLCKRINLWGDPQHYIDVPHHRKPCSTEIVRLTKSCYRSYDDAESIAAPYSKAFTDLIVIWHMGFVRRRDKMVDKCVHIQRDVFLIEPDKKLEGMTTFEPDKWFAPEDLKPITEPLPAIIQEWAAHRMYP